MLKTKHFSVLLLLIGFYSSADAAILCSNASGSVFVRADVCRAGETKLDPVALGLTGPKGTPGADGADGVSGWELQHDSVDVAAGDLKSIHALCSVGKKPVGWGFNNLSDTGRIVNSAPFSFDGVPGWQIAVENNDSVTRRFEVFVVCVIAPDETA